VRVNGILSLCYHMLCSNVAIVRPVLYGIKTFLNVFKNYVIKAVYRFSLLFLSPPFFALLPSRTSPFHYS